jgi:dolichyl-phosphate-mannose-protein mannosyltransferase
VASLEAERIAARIDRLWLGCAGACVLWGLWLRTHELWRPLSYAFDEHHFVDNAHNYLLRLPDLNDHPPLGKLLIALGISLVGDNSAGWRCAPALFGAATIGVAALLARRLFPGSLAWAFALVFVSLDGFAIAYSRVALLDGMLSCLLLLSCWLALGTRAWALAGAAIAGGLALSIKFTGVCYLAPLACAVLTRSGGGRLRWLGLAPAISTLVYYACYALGLWISRAPWDPLSVWQATVDLLRHHAGLIDMQNPSTSSWVTWFVPTRPLTLWRTVEGSTLRSVTSRGNPLLWLCCSASALGLTCAVAWRGLAPLLTAGKFRIGSSWLPARALVYLLTAYWACLAPWILTRRDSYIYHYLPSYLVAIVLVSGLCGSLYQARRAWALALTGLVIAVSAMYAARWAGLPRTIATPPAPTAPAAAP